MTNQIVFSTSKRNVFLIKIVANAVCWTPGTIKSKAGEQLGIIAKPYHRLRGPYKAIFHAVKSPVEISFRAQILFGHNCNQGSLLQQIVKLYDQE